MSILSLRYLIVGLPVAFVYVYGWIWGADAFIETIQVWVVVSYFVPVSRLGALQLFKKYIFEGARPPAILVWLIGLGSLLAAAFATYGIVGLSSSEAYAFVFVASACFYGMNSWYMATMYATHGRKISSRYVVIFFSVTLSLLVALTTIPNFTLVRMFFQLSLLACFLLMMLWLSRDRFFELSDESLIALSPLLGRALLSSLVVFLILFVARGSIFKYDYSAESALVAANTLTLIFAGKLIFFPWLRRYEQELVLNPSSGLFIRVIALIFLVASLATILAVLLSVTQMDSASFSGGTWVTITVNNLEFAVLLVSAILACPSSLALVTPSASLLSSVLVILLVIGSAVVVETAMWLSVLCNFMVVGYGYMHKDSLRLESDA